MNLKRVTNNYNLTAAAENVDKALKKISVIIFWLE